MEKDLLIVAKWASMHVALLAIYNYYLCTNHMDIRKILANTLL